MSFSSSGRRYALSAEFPLQGYRGTPTTPWHAPNVGAATLRAVPTGAPSPQRSQSQIVRWAPNAITVGRAVLAAYGARVARRKQASLAIVLIAAGAIGDAADGWLARRLGATSALGARLDPVADRVVIAAALLTLWELDPTSRLPVALLSMREAALTAGAALAITKPPAETGVTSLGKLSTLMVLSGAVTAGIGAAAGRSALRRTGTVALTAAIIPSYASLLQYRSRMRRSW